MFAQINWEIFNHFTGKYEAIIYKLCKDYIGVPHTPKMSIEHFREYMGIEPAEYPDFKKLNVRVIAKPVKCINDSELSDIVVKPQFFKDGGGRKVTSLHFRIEHKKQTQLPLSPLDEDSPFRFAKAPISPVLQEKYLALPRTGAEIELCIERANEYSAQQEKRGKAVDYAALYAAAILEGWHEGYAIVKVKRDQKKIAKDSLKREAIEEDLADEKKTRRLAEENAHAWARYEALSEVDKQGLETAFLDRASEPDLWLFHKQGRDAPVFKIYVRQRMMTDTE